MVAHGRAVLDGWCVVWVRTWKARPLVLLAERANTYLGKTTETSTHTG